MNVIKMSKAQVPDVRERISAAQGYRCLLCNVSFQQREIKNGKAKMKHIPTLDHCHGHGHVRGVLCNNCNGKEGQILNLARACQRDGTALNWLNKLVAYLNKNHQPQTPYIHPEHKTEDEKRLATNKKARQSRAKAKAAELLKRAHGK